MKLNELINVLYNIKVIILLENECCKTIYNGLVDCLKSDDTFKKYKVKFVLPTIDKDLMIVVEEVK